jgi:hypothetical protein
LSYLHNYCDLTHRTARTIEILADYNFKVQFLPGKKIVSEDILSRIEWPYNECSWPQVDTGGEEVVAPVIQGQAPVLDWVAEQDADEDSKLLKQWLQAGRRPPKEAVIGSSGTLQNCCSNFEQFELQDGKVCSMWTNEGSLPNRYLKMVSTFWRKTILEGNHKELGHIRSSKMKLSLHKFFYWFGMLADVDTCKVCCRRLPGNSLAPLVQEVDSFFNQ